MIIKNSQDEIQNYLVDASNTKGFCESVYFPENENDVIKILKEANLNEKLVTIAGNRTGLTGAAVPNGGIVISTDKLNKIIEINTDKNYAIVEPGVLLSDLQKRLSKINLIYPPDPTEKNCFIGGTIATNASGAQSIYYGATRNYILGLELLSASGEKICLERNQFIADDLDLSLKTADGEIINLSLPECKMPDTKNAAGYFCKPGMDAIDLFIGSEGTLGFITKIKLKIVPKPKNVLSIVLFFKDENNSLLFLEKARYLSKTNRNRVDEINALSLEYFDDNALSFLRYDYKNIPLNSNSAIWFEQIVVDNDQQLLEKWLQLFKSVDGDESDAWFAIDEKEKKEIINFRHTISTKVNEFIAKNNFRKLGTDVAVPDDKFINYYHYLRKVVSEAGIKFVIYGHFGDSHVHLNMLPENDQQFETGRKLYYQICREAIRLGGTFSAEHGVGKNKTDLLLEMYGEENIKMMMAIKKKLDPNLILCRGNIFKF